MEVDDYELVKFEAEGAAPLPASDQEGSVPEGGDRLWYATYGSGEPVILLHGGLGHAGNWGHQILALVDNGYRAVVIDSRGHGRSTRDERPFSYDLMASGVLAVMDALHLAKAILVGWSDGACIALILAARVPSRIAGVFFFACNMDPGGVKAFEATPALNRCFSRHRKDYARLSATPGNFQALVDAVTPMQQTQPNYTPRDLSQIDVPVLIVQSEHDEFIKQEHAAYLARSIPGAALRILKGVSHFAPVQKPQQFNIAMIEFVREVSSLSD